MKHKADQSLQAEITSIAKKRSDFEHKLNARGSNPSDYARYAEYEMNLEALRRKRVKRMGVKATNHSGQRRIFFVLDRATRKFHGDVGLWVQYITFARKQKSNKKVSEILTKVLRLHPTKPELWIYAASYAMEERGDTMEARSYMQRGLRFCKKSAKLWLEYARLELIHIAKIMGRRQILGLDQGTTVQNNTGVKGGDIGGDMVVLPAITAEDIHPNIESTDDVDQDTLDKMDASPVLSGAIPMAVFSAATKQFGGDDQLSLEFFDMVAKFDQLPCQAAILTKILEALQPSLSKSPAALIRHIRQPVIGVAIKSADFPTAFGSALSRIKPAIATLSSAQLRSVLSREMIEWLLSYLEEDLDPDIRTVVQMTLRKIFDQYQADIGILPAEKAGEVFRLLEQMDARGLEQIAKPGRVWALHMWPSV
ncbi:MAG: hypothetical protein Q9164_000327 [Protoblastenia rupestris]